MGPEWKLQRDVPEDCLKKLLGESCVLKTVGNLGNGWGRVAEINGSDSLLFPTVTTPFKIYKDKDNSMEVKQLTNISLLYYIYAYDYKKL
jgi:hypothetical protein